MAGVARSVGACVGCLLSIGPPVRAQCQYDVTIIQGPSFVTIGKGINNQGHVVGHYGDEWAFLWTPEGGFTSLGFPPGTPRSAAYDINDRSQIVGSFSSVLPPMRLAFLRDGATFVSLGTLPGGTFSDAYSINESGQIAGSWGNNITGNPALQGFLWQDGKMTNLGVDLPAVNGEAYDINDAGQVTGWFGEADWIDAHAFIWEAGSVTDLGVIPEGYTSEALAINGLGEVAGRGFIIDPECAAYEWHATLWNGEKVTDLGLLPGRLRTRAMDINDAGRVVGIFDGYPNCSWIGGFVWQNGVMTDLDELISPDAGITMEGASAINDMGQIVGWATSGGLTVAVLLTPQPASLGDINSDCAVDVVDLLMVLAAWGTCPVPPQPCPADVEGDGVVGIADLLTVLADWG